MSRLAKGAAADVRRGEGPFAVAMACVFFLIISSFWILKPLKKGSFIQFYDVSGFHVMGLELDAAQAELLAKVANMGVAALAAVVFSASTRRLARERLLLAFTGVFVVGHAVFASALSELSAATVWSFYLYGDLFATLMVVSFFAFLNDSVSPAAAKRLYGPAGLGGVAGGAAGSIFLATWIEALSAAAWLGVCVALGVLIAAVTVWAGRCARRLPAASRPRAVARPEDGEPGALHAALDGARLALRSGYLLSVIAIVGLYELASTLLDFQFTSTVEHFLDGDAIAQHFSLVYGITNGTALLVQLLLTRLVMTRWGVGAALLVLPAAMLGSSGVFLALPTLWTGSLLSTADNAFAYSINQSAKEALYVPTRPAEKYRAKAFIDIFVQRFAKAVAVVTGLGITIAFQQFAAVRWISLLTTVLLLVWIRAARYAGRRFEEIDGEADAAPAVERRDAARAEVPAAR